MILVLDDNADLVEITVEVLKAEGLVVTGACSIQEAQVLQRTFVIKTLMIDLGLYEQNKKQCNDFIQSLDQEANVVMFTGRTDFDPDKTELSKIAKLIVYKPFISEELATSLRNLNK